MTKSTASCVVIGMALTVAAGPSLPSSAAQTTEPLIEWSKSRKLRRADFKGRVAAIGNTAARSFIVVQASWQCENGSLVATIKAVFDPSRSTWSPGQESFSATNRRMTTAGGDSGLLEHEQTHFDIAELFARKIRAHLEQLTDACTRPGATVPLGAVIEDYQRDLDQEQARYDRETTFGTDARMQWNWTSKIRKALDSR